MRKKYIRLQLGAALSWNFKKNEESIYATLVRIFFSEDSNFLLFMYF